MRLEDLSFSYPEELVAEQRAPSSRVMRVGLSPFQYSETTPQEILNEIPSGDVLVVNDTRVIPARIFAGEDQSIEILFIESEPTRKIWQVLFPAGAFKVGDRIPLPEGFQATLSAKGRPQTLTLSESLPLEYFDRQGHMPLPPYIQKKRAERQSRPEDREAYQTDWANIPGSSAAPTASFHFKNSDLRKLRERGVHVETVTLHVGLGTYLPVKTPSLRDHQMHSEAVQIPFVTLNRIREAKARGSQVWALGTTATRALEGNAKGHLREDSSAQAMVGSTDLLILPGFEWQVVDRLLTNFHQPESTLLALVSAFAQKPEDGDNHLAGRDRVFEVYQEAMAKKFRLFSYGDLSVWLR